jgi:hypothetical protein
MTKRLSITLMTVLLLSGSSLVFGQVENVPAYHPVYTFLKRMELKGMLQRYHDAILPLSRSQVASHLVEAKAGDSSLTQVDKDILNEYLLEFRYDIEATADSNYSLLDFRDPAFSSTISSMFSEKQKYLYSYADTTATFFVDGLLTIDMRSRRGDNLGGTKAEFAQFGGRIRGTVYHHLGYYLQGTNAQFWGSRQLLAQDKQIGQAYTLGILNTQSFDLAEGYVRYEGGILSAEVGQERMLWGNGYGDKLILSDSVRVFPSIRADAQYKSLKYTFMHGWLMGHRADLVYDTVNKFVEPVVADKYFAAHRLEFSFPSLFDIGFQEMAIYSNRSVDLAYLNPATLIESAQRSRDERDNVFWAFDIQTHAVSNWEFQASILFDDINFAMWGTKNWQNRYGYQLGTMVVDPLRISNLSLAAEYTRIQPYTFSHNRSRDDDYGSLGRLLGHHIGPNADGWYFRADYNFSHRLIASADFELEREGNNTYDAAGNLLVNVGGDFLQPHRSQDSEEQQFLGGDYVRTYTGKMHVTYEFVHQMFLELHYQYQRRHDVSNALIVMNHDFGAALRFDF